MFAALGPHLFTSKLRSPVCGKIFNFSTVSTGLRRPDTILDLLKIVKGAVSDFFVNTPLCSRQYFLTTPPLEPRSNAPRAGFRCACFSYLARCVKVRADALSLRSPWTLHA